MIRLTADHPRIRGEHSGVSWIVKNGTGSSPHTRGAPGFDSFWRRVRGIIPAYAGSTASGRAWRRRSGDHPRIRGEHDDRQEHVAELGGSSPHTRGARFVETIHSNALGIIPAYAGSTYDFDVWCWNSCGSSPHTRGAPSPGGMSRAGTRIIPAYAGSTPPWRASCVAPADHPRIRGEHAKQALNTVYGKGSSPHTRGARG